MANQTRKYFKLFSIKEQSRGVLMIIFSTRTIDMVAISICGRLLNRGEKIECSMSRFTDERHSTNQLFNYLIGVPRALPEVPIF